jgi:hypothetical protein
MGRRASTERFSRAEAKARQQAACRTALARVAFAARDLLEGTDARNAQNPHAREDTMSTLDPDNDLPQPDAPGHDTGALGPGDSSDTGSDTAGAKRHDFDRDTELDNHALETGEMERLSDTDTSGTGERASADGDETLMPDADVLPDRIESYPDADETSQRDDELPGGERDE